MRTKWAVTAAEHMVAALRAIGEGRGIEADIAVQDAGRAYRWVLYSIGTIPGDRTDEVYAATIYCGRTVTQALDAIGA